MLSIKCTKRRRGDLDRARLGERDPAALAAGCDSNTAAVAASLLGGGVFNPAAAAKVNSSVGLAQTLGQLPEPTHI
jgi:hypothetical protein